MKKFLFIVFALPFITQCSSDGFNNNNPYLPNYRFTYDINLSLPSYSQLNYPGNAIVINQPGIGVMGLIVFNGGAGFNAYDAGCPNQPLTDCSTLQRNGIMAVCPCDNEEYNLYTGLSEGGLPYPLKRYRAELNGNILRVYN